MKKIIIITTFIFLPFCTHSQEVVFPQKIDEIKQKVEYKKESLHEKIQLKQQELQQKKATSTDTVVQIFTQEKLLKISEHAFDKIEAILVKFEGIVARLEVRISKLEESGVDVVSSKELLSKAKISIEDTYVLIFAAEANLNNEKTLSINIKQLKDSFTEYKDMLKSTQDTLLLVVESLKNKDNLGDEGLLSE